MNFAAEKVRIRRFLRDPDANIWDDKLLLRIHNESQREIQQKTRVLEDVKVVRVPPYFDWSYLQDFEEPYIYEGHGPTFQAMHYYQQSEYVISQQWEGLILQDIDETWTGQGSAFTHPWEGFVTAPADIIPLRFPRGFYEALLVAWDDEPVDYRDKKEISSEDPTWKTRQGDPQAYYRPDVTEPFFVLYPQPSSPTWDSTTLTALTEAVAVVTQTWEDSATYFTGSGTVCTIDDSDYENAPLFDWEYKLNRGGRVADEDSIKALWAWECAENILGTDEAEALLTNDRMYKTGMGPLSSLSEFFDLDDSISSSEISSEGNVLFVYRVEPVDIDDDSQEGSFPDFLKKYVEYSVLERAYSVDNDGQIDSLRDYWGQRKQLGIEIIKRYMSKRKVDRDYRLVTKGVPGGRTQTKYPRLPDEYPAI